jgi:hypothetical protein
MDEEIAQFNEVLPKNLAKARSLFVDRLMMYVNHIRVKRGSKYRGGVRYTFDDRPHWWPSTTEYSNNMSKTLLRRDLEVLHSTLIGSMREETPYAILKLLEELKKKE